MKCLNCGIDFEPRRASAKFHSDACRVEYARRKDKVERSGADELPEPKAALTETDKLFAAYRPDYYVFDDKIYKQTCHLVAASKQLCDKQFESHLELLRFCSPDHQRAMVYILSGNAEKAKELI